MLTLSGCRRVVAMGLVAVLCAAAPGLGAETLRMGGTGASIATFGLLAREYRKQDPSFQLDIVPNLGSAGGIQALLGGAIQISATTRPLKSEERAKGAREFAYGRTAFVMVTARPGLDGLSTGDIADLYAAAQPRWPDGQPVRLVLRPAHDSDSTLLAALSPAVKAALMQAMAREGMVVAMTDQEAVEAVERLPGALGTSTLALLMAENRRVKPLALDGVAPTLANLESGRYPHVKTMYLVLREDAPPAAVKFGEFIRSEAGQRLLARTGHLSVVMPPITLR